MGYLTPLQRRGLALSGVAFSFCAFIIAQSSRFVKNFFLKSQFYFLGFRLHLLLSRSAPLRNDWWKNWETPHGIGLLKSYPLELLLCLYCITTWAICQGVFGTFFFEFLATPTIHRSGSWVLLSPLDTLIVSYFKGFVKRFFKVFSLLLAPNRPALREVFHFLLTWL